MDRSPTAAGHHEHQSGEDHGGRAIRGAAGVTAAAIDVLAGRPGSSGCTTAEKATAALRAGLPAASVAHAR